jgi:hypothetical protein
MKNNETLIVDGKELQIWIKKIYLCKYIHVAKDLAILNNGFPLRPPVSSAWTKPRTESGRDIVVLATTCKANFPAQYK